MAGTAARFLREESGATAIEYGLIAALVVLVMMAGLTQFADTLNGLYDYVTASFIAAVSS